MTDFALQSVSPFSATPFARPRPGAPGLTVAERTGLGIATLKARSGRIEALAETLRAAHGIELAPGPKLSAAGPITLLGTGPGAWLVLCEDGGWRFARDLAAAVAGVGSVSDQSSGYGILRLSGPKVRATLAKGVPIDLHPTAFAPGDVAVTLAGHVGIVLWQVDAAPTFDIAVFRSFAESFAHWLEISAAEFGATPAF